MNPVLVEQIRKAARYMDKQVGMKGSYKVQPGSTPIMQTPVTVRSYPIEMREMDALTRSGLSLDTVRWVMCTEHQAEVRAGDVLAVGGQNYEVLQAIKDELNVEWTLYTRKMR